MRGVLSALSGFESCLSRGFNVAVIITTYAILVAFTSILHITMKNTGYLSHQHTSDGLIAAPLPVISTSGGILAAHTGNGTYTSMRNCIDVVHYLRGHLEEFARRMSL